MHKNNEACQLFIEQQIEEGLGEGKTPYSIGKELAVWLERLFDAKVPARTIEQRARRTEGKNATNVAPCVTPEPVSEKPDIQEIKSWGGSRKGAGRPPKFRAVENNTHFRTSGTGENEWYTPAEYIEAARAVMGGIDLDPASSDKAQESVKAADYYTAETDGLSKQWSGRVWLNPPYSQPLIRQFSEKVVSEYLAENIEAGIVLTHNYTDTGWFHTLESSASILCFTRGRVRFIGSDGSLASPTQGSTFFLFTDDTDIQQRFCDIFRKYGFLR